MLSACRNTNIIKACRGEPVDRTPVWLMRQAGRYLPQYREIVKKSQFFKVCKTPELVAKITLQPLDEFDIDAVVLFSDILVIQDAMGFGVSLGENGIVIEKRIETLSDIDAVAAIQPSSVVENLQYVYDGIKETIKLLDNRVPLIGFAGSPWTLLCYLIDGLSSTRPSDRKQGERANQWFQEHPDKMKILLDAMTDFVVAHLVAQVHAGCHMLQLFDSWGGAMEQKNYVKFLLPSIERVAVLVKAQCPETPLVFFAKSNGDLLPEFSQLKYDAISIDFDTDLSKAKSILHPVNVGIQGNLHPNVILKSKEEIESATKEMIETMGDQRRYIANLGHGCEPEFDVEHVRVFVDAVHKYSKEMIAKHQETSTVVN